MAITEPHLVVQPERSSKHCRRGDRSQKVPHERFSRVQLH
jgi:hypothetical protein